MQIIYHTDAREQMMQGVDYLADAIKVTLGPKGRNAALDQKANLHGASYADDAAAGSHVLITNDGVTIAQSIVLKDPVQKIGADLIKDAANKTNDTAGDGTTTATVLTQVLLHRLNHLIAAGYDPLQLRRGMKGAADVVLEELRKHAVPIRNAESLAAVATISCQEEDMGQLIADAFSKVGMEGVITIEDSGRDQTSMTIQEGIVFDRGYIDPLMVTDNKTQTAELENPYILLCDTKFTDYRDLLDFLILCAEDERPALIICEGVEGSALGLINQNRREGDMVVVAVQAPEYGEGRTWRMQDLALQTGGVYICKDSFLQVRNVSREMLGSAARVKVTAHQTMITDPHGDPEQISNRIKELRFLANNTEYDFNKKRYRERLAKFVSGVAKIDVGGLTEPEIWERKMRMEDAVNTARAAIEEGIVPGGGIALLDICPTIRAYADTLKDEQRQGALAVAEALKAPAIQILNNAGVDGKYQAEHLLEQPTGIGYNVETMETVDMMAAGIVDPVKITRLAFETAVSVAGTIATAEAVVYP